MKEEGEKGRRGGERKKGGKGKVMKERLYSRSALPCVSHNLAYLLCGNSAQHTGVANTKLRVISTSLLLTVSTASFPPLHTVQFLTTYTSAYCKQPELDNGN